jgi:ribosome-interacting GTPase 1
MINYNQAKIYKIESDLGDKIYVGATTKEKLSQRMAQHRYSYKIWKEGNNKCCSSNQLFDEYGIDNCRIVLIESCPSTSIDEIKARESFFIRTLNCVNKTIPDRTKQEYRNDETHKQRKAEMAKKDYEKNKERLLTKFKCECGGCYTTCTKLKHEKTTKHKTFIDSIKPV